MLKKLLKYEFKSVSKTLVPLLLAIFCMSLLSSVMIILNNIISRGNRESVIAIIFSVISTTIMTFSILALVATIFVLIFILLQRYYKSFFSDEGYLTFTLPVHVKDLLIAKVISGFVWTLIGIIVVLVSVAFFLLFVTAADGHLINFGIFTEISKAISVFYNYIGTLNSVLFTVESLLIAAVGITSQMLLYYLSITTGSIIAKKHKILASIGMYFAINTVTGTISSVLMAIIMLINSDFEQSLNSMYTMSHYYLIGIIIIYVIMGTASFLISKSLLQKKLNLE